MIDPLRQLVINRDSESVQDEVIRVEEAIDCRLANSRFFILINARSLLNVIVATDSSIVSAKLGGYDIVVNRDYYNETHETWAIGDKPYQKLTNLNWSSHVRGSELVLSSLSGNTVSSSVIYELTRQNELICLNKLKNIHLQHQVSYFNLNPLSAASKTPIDGHIIAIRCNAGFHRIQTRMTKLLCQCNKQATISPQSFVGDIPLELRHHQLLDETSTSSAASKQNGDDTIICDAIYSLESTCTLDFLQAHLQFGTRVLVIEVHNAKVSNTSSQNRSAGNGFHSSSHGSVTSSTRATNSPNDLMCQDMLRNKIENDEGSYPATSSTASMTVAKNQESESSDANQVKIKLEQLDNDVTNSNRTPLPPLPGNTPTELSNATNHPSTMLRLRVRITNFGVSILPYMMTNYSCTYKFAW